LPTSSATDLFDEIAAGAADESELWRDALRDEPERVLVFSPLVDPELALGVETIYEAYLVHYGRPRLFDAPDRDVAILLGDYLYAHGLVRIAETGRVDAVAELAELISRCASLRAEGAAARDGEEWLATARRLGPGRADADGALRLHRTRFE
jgi:hypothetical protein